MMGGRHVFFGNVIDVGNKDFLNALSVNLEVGFVDEGRWLDWVTAKL